MIRNLSLALLFTAGLAGTAGAAGVSFALQVDQLRDSSTNAMGVNGVVFLVASTADATFDPVAAGSYQEGDFIGSGDDVIIFRTDLTPNSTPGLVFETTSTIVLDDADAGAGLIPGLNAGDPISIYWFPTTSNGDRVGPVTLVAGAEGGAYRHPSGLDGSEPWVMPASGSSIPLNFQTSDSPSIGFGSNDPSSSFAVQGFVVPEPSSLLSLSFGALLLLRRRR